MCVTPGQFSLSPLTAIGCTPPELVYIASRAGYDFVSLRLAAYGLPGQADLDVARNKEMLRQTKAALAETGIKLHEVELARIFDGIDPKRYLPAMEAAAELGGRHFLCNIWTDDRKFAMESFAELCELAEPFGLTVELEFVPIATVCDLAGAMEVLRASGRDNVGIVIDAFHFHHSGGKLEDLNQVPREWIHCVHLCDTHAEMPASKEELTWFIRHERLYAGEGVIHLSGIVRRLPEVPYSLEIPHDKRVKELGWEEHARRCLQTARDYLNRSGH